MANYDDLLDAAQKRTRTGRSFFPAANGSYRGIYYTLGGRPSANAINSSPSGQTIMTTGYGRTSGFQALPPEQNPAYQSRIADHFQANRSTSGVTGNGGSAYTWITTPSGGLMRVPTGSAQRYLEMFPARPAVPATAEGAPAVAGQNAASIYDPNRAQDITHIQNALQFPRLYGQGYGNVPVVSNPPTQFERIQRGQSGFGEIASFAAHNLLGVSQNQNLLAGLGRNWFGGAGGQQAAQYGSNVSTGQPPSQPMTANSGFNQSYYNYNPSPAPPRRYSDLGYY